jgi:hypothetical protein
MLKKKILANFQTIIELFTQKLSLNSLKYGSGIRDPRSGIRKKPIPDPGSRGQKGTGSRIRIRNTDVYKRRREGSAFCCRSTGRPPPRCVWAASSDPPGSGSTPETTEMLTKEVLWIRIRILPSTRKNGKKNNDFYYF